MSEFQSTRPRGARQDLIVLGLVVEVVSIHAPAWGATVDDGHAVVGLDVSIHAPAWGATIMSVSCLMPREFQSTRPRGARLTNELAKMVMSEFQSTRPRGARRLRRIPYGTYSVFQSTRPRGARQDRRAAVPCLPRVSIHAPAWGATGAPDQPEAVTLGFNPRARVGRDRRRLP